MPPRRYYSLRKGTNEGAVRLDLETLRRLFLNTYRKYESLCYFQEALGYACVDEYDHYVLGTLAQKPEDALLLARRKPLKLEPLNVNVLTYSEDDLFDLTGLAGFKPGTPLQLTLRHADGTSETITVNHSYSDLQIKWFKAGSALNYMKTLS